MAKLSTCSEVSEELLYVMREDYPKGWRIDLLVEKLSSKVEEKLLLCNCCNGLLRDACLYQGALRCVMCIPDDAAIQPVEMNRELVNEKKIYCPLRLKGCEWSDMVNTAVQHLRDCFYLLEHCPLGCIYLEGERKGELVKIEKRHIHEHIRDSCPIREVLCECCEREVKASEMNLHLENCENLLLSCPNSCKGEGDEGIKHVRRKDILLHLDKDCPLQTVQCVYWDIGCKEEMERRHTHRHEREYLHLHFKLSLTEMKQRQYDTNNTNKLLSAATDKIAMLEKNDLINCKKLTKLKQESYLQLEELNTVLAILDTTTDNLTIVTKKLATQESALTKVKQEFTDTTELLTKKLNVANAESNDKVEHLENQITSNAREICSLSTFLFSYTQPPTGRLEWKIQRVKQKVRTTETSITNSEPFYVGLYKCKCKIDWDHDETGNVGVFICIMKGDCDDKLYWPVRYRLTVILINQTNNEGNLVKSNEITLTDLEKFPSCFKKPTGHRNPGIGIESLISNTEILQKQYCKQDSIMLHISIELIPTL